jgi:hypothetical protein
MQTAEFLAIKLHVNVFLNTMEIHTTVVDRNVSAIPNVQEIWPVLTTNVKTLASELVGLKLFVLSTIIFQLVHVLMVQQEMLSSTARLFQNMNQPWKKILVIHHRARLEQFVDDLEALLYVNVFQDTSEILMIGAVILNVQSIQIVRSQRHVPTTNVEIHVKEKFVDTMLSVRRLIMLRFVHVLKKWLAIHSLNAKLNEIQ